jgi:MHS family proline/betaine transporter-like MFS transporter
MNTSHLAASSRVAGQDTLLKRASIAGFIGTFVEWFDYACYGYLAVVFATVFFPESESRVGLLAAYAIFALSFVIRPVGGVVWGHLGDRIGRKAVLSLSILIMSVSTAVIAFLPTYETAGVAAPVLLLATRMVQGFAASGEYAGAASFIAEYAPKHRRGLYTCLVPAGEAAGLLAASLFVALLHFLLTDAALHTWGWRIPFLLALPFGAIGLYVRRQLEETPQFRALERSDETAAVPVLELLTKHRAQVLIAFGGAMINAVGFYLVLSYMPVYLTAELGVSDRVAFVGSSISLFLYLLATFGMGLLSDRFGRSTVLIVCSVLFLVMTLPLFMLVSRFAAEAVSTGSLTAIFGAWALLAICLAMNGGTLPTFLCELFPTRVRFSGFAISFNSANALFGGTAPWISTWLIGATNNTMAPAWYLMLAAIVTLFAILASRHRAIAGNDQAATFHLKKECINE